MGGQVPPRQDVRTQRHLKHLSKLPYAEINGRLMIKVQLADTSRFLALSTNQLSTSTVVFPSCASEGMLLPAEWHSLLWTMAE